ncbi:MAG: hypothetical protein U0414_20285 [Polyangiaceae bacterium]
MTRPLAPLALAAAIALAPACDDGSTPGTGGDHASTTTTHPTTTSSSGVTTATTSGSTSASTATSTSASSSTGGPPVGCLTDVSAGHKTVSCDGGITYDVEIPAACVAGPCGLIVDLHGYTMTGESEEENTGMRARGQAHGYVVVQPTAPKDGFGQPSWDQPTHAPLVHHFLADLAASLPIDPKRIHAMGFSQGGGMTFRLLCGHADFFASAAPIGAIEGCEFAGANTPSEEVDILQVHGHDDAIVNFQSVAVPQRNAALAAWPFGAPSMIEQDGKHLATRWTTPSGTAFEFWEHDYKTSAQVFFVSIKGHCVPGGTDFSGTPAGYSCEDANTFVFGELAMQFFLAHPKP